MPIEDRPQGFLARLNTAQRVILFIAGLVAVGLVAFPPWTCEIGYGTSMDLGRAFIFNWESVPRSGYGRYGVGCASEAGTVVSARLLGELLVPFAIGALGYFIFRKPAAAPPAPAPPAS